MCIHWSLSRGLPPSASREERHGRELAAQFMPLHLFSPFHLADFAGPLFKAGNDVKIAVNTHAECILEELGSREGGSWSQIWV